MKVAYELTSVVILSYDFYVFLCLLSVLPERIFLNFENLFLWVSLCASPSMESEMSSRWLLHVQWCTLHNSISLHEPNGFEFIQLYKAFTLIVVKANNKLCITKLENFYRIDKMLTENGSACVRNGDCQSLVLKIIFDNKIGIQCAINRWVLLFSVQYFSVEFFIMNLFICRGLLQILLSNIRKILDDLYIY